MKRYLAIICLTILAVGCIKNDIPYPKVFGEITAFEVEGQIGNSIIDNTKMTVSLSLDESIDITNVKIVRFEVSNDAKVSPEIASNIDLSSDYFYTLTTYQDYLWTISANQTVERYINALNQVGEATFDLANKYILVKVSTEQSLSDITITSAKLGPVGSTISPDPLQVKDFRGLQTFTVKYRDITEAWTIRFTQATVTVSADSVDAWAKHAYFTGVYQPSLGTPFFEYRKSDESSWTRLPSSDIVISGTTITGKASSLEPSTEYYFRAGAGTTYSSELSFTTEAAAQMTNMSFDEWVKEGKSWFPNANLTSDYWWDTGNKGANTLGEANPTSPEETFVVRGKAAKMVTTKILTLIAGGNVFSGQYVKTSGLGAQVDFGRPFTSRPTSLKGYYSYASTPINVAPEKYGYSSMLNKPDRCHIFVYITDWDEPFRVDTNAKVYLDTTDTHVIGYGALIDSVGTGNQYKPFEIDIRYRNNRKPKYCAVVAVASLYADFFTGGIGSTMYVDEFKFEYE